MLVSLTWWSNEDDDIKSKVMYVLLPRYITESVLHNEKDNSCVHQTHIIIIHSLIIISITYTCNSFWINLFAFAIVAMFLIFFVIQVEEEQLNKRNGNADAHLFPPYCYWQPLNLQQFIMTILTKTKKRKKQGWHFNFSFVPSTFSTNLIIHPFADIGSSTVFPSCSHHSAGVAALVLIPILGEEGGQE